MNSYNNKKSNSKNDNNDKRIIESGDIFFLLPSKN